MSFHKYWKLIVLKESKVQQLLYWILCNFVKNKSEESDVFEAAVQHQ